MPWEAQFMYPCNVCSEPVRPGSASAAAHRQHHVDRGELFLCRTCGKHYRQVTAARHMDGHVNVFEAEERE